MSTAAPAGPLLAGASWAELVAELGVGVLLLHGTGTVRAAGGVAAELLAPSGEPPPGLVVLAAQVVRADAAATVPLVVGGRRLWVEMYPVRLGSERLALALLRPVDTDTWRGKGLLDPLTGLPNRVLLFDRLGHALGRARVRGCRVTLVLVTVSGLAEANLAGGHACGDRLLSRVAAELRAGLPEDHTVARYAGGTFAVVADHPHGTGEPVAVGVAKLVTAPVRTGWATSDGTDAVPDLVGRAHIRLQA